MRGRDFAVNCFLPQDYQTKKKEKHIQTEHQDTTIMNETEKGKFFYVDSCSHYKHPIFFSVGSNNIQYSLLQLLRKKHATDAALTFYGSRARASFILLLQRSYKIQLSILDRAKFQ
jgi:hypothetical protein